MTRKTDNQYEPVHFQMDRFAQQNNEWFYLTRESVERGPFDTRDAAANDLALHISGSQESDEINWGHVSFATRRTDAHDEPVHFQMDRFAQQNNEWFYLTRESIERGPFDSKYSAESDLTSYIYHRHNIEKFSH